MPVQRFVLFLTSSLKMFESDHFEHAKLHSNRSQPRLLVPLLPMLVSEDVFKSHSDLAFEHDPINVIGHNRGGTH